MKIFAKDIPIIERRIARGDLLGHIAEDYKCHPYAIKQALRLRTKRNPQDLFTYKKGHPIIREG
jgi:hypothetical protein